MRIEQLKYFVKAAECGSINKAAESFYIAQPAMSDALKKLESEIGAPLLIKNHTGVTLTLEGQVLYQASQDILQRLNEALEKITVIHSTKRTSILQHQVHFAISHGVSINIMPKLLNMFHRIQPDLQAIISEKNAQTCIKQLIDGAADCCILFVYDKEFQSKEIQDMIKSNNLYVNLLRQCSTVAIVSQKNPLASKQKLTIKELLKQPFLVINTNFDSHWLIDNLNALETHTSINFEFITDNAGMSIEYLTNHDRLVAIAPDFYPLFMEKYHQQLSQIPIVKTNPIQIVYMCLPQMQSALSSYEKIIALYMQQ